MKIDKTFKIKEKYFKAILKREKVVELRHEYVEPNSIIKLECNNGKYIIFKSGNCVDVSSNWDIFAFDSWFDDFVINYCKKYDKIYSIRIAEILEVK